MPDRKPPRDPARSTGVGVLGTGSFVPERRVDSKEVARLLGVENDWITGRIGVLERRFAAEDETSTELAVHASRAALVDAGVEAADIDAIILATSTPETPVPGSAARLQAALGATEAVAFDVNAACAGFLIGLDIAAGFLGRGERDHVLVVGSDTYSQFLNPGDRRTYPLFGDGAGAVVVGRVPAGEGILGLSVRTDGTMWDFAVGGAPTGPSAAAIAEGAHYLTMRGRDIADLVRAQLPLLVAEAVKEHGITIADIDHFICHQANPRLVREAAAAAGLTPDQVVMTGDTLGNTASASLPIGLDAAVRRGRVKAGDTVLMVTFGAGMTWGRALMRVPGPVDADVAA
ncbi:MULTISPECIES: 3-oxoacyl-ACP synthase III family protein [Streptomyces]|uniref:3-oxoacyl-ACP synthase III family protein n=1 Tax=Streptomyces TaxID=1883 RepID=UPI0007C5469D|nr:MULTISPECIES: ketoacyl-ACP synthase III [Streptomyces]MDP9951671.1 3-oxoacyl-[acyl-carrier-protein] synthase-3 [Streptomyces sp. DSM 41269]